MASGGPACCLNLDPLVFGPEVEPLDGCDVPCAENRHWVDATRDNE